MDKRTRHEKYGEKVYYHKNLLGKKPQELKHLQHSIQISISLKNGGKHVVGSCYLLKGDDFDNIDKIVGDLIQNDHFQIYQ